jgi:hypothetical protein
MFGFLMKLKKREKVGEPERIKPADRAHAPAFDPQGQRCCARPNALTDAKVGNCRGPVGFHDDQPAFSHGKKSKKNRARNGGGDARAFDSRTAPVSGS